MKGDWCPIGPLNLHTWNYERDECIWCGPNALCAQPGRWVQLIEDGMDVGLAWTTWGPLTEAQTRVSTRERRSE